MKGDERFQIKAYLQRKTSDQLVSLVLKFCESDKNAAKKLLDEAQQRENDANASIQFLCDKVEKMYENREEYVPKFEEIKKKLKNLLLKGEWEAVLKVCDVILKYSCTFTYDCYYPEEAYDELVEIFKLIPQAIEASPMSLIDGLIYCIECDIRAPVELSPFSEWFDEKGTEKDWNIVAETLLAHLAEGESYTSKLVAKDQDIPERLRHWVGEALAFADREEEAMAYGYRPIGWDPDAKTD
ncbi:MAG: hypothetical protein LBR22_10275 [Desulfovibrio sp.]|jgi:uncharacterized Zn finger protein|nr:hypothetical protein [Desulfovibrio sp.]